ncbi:hypothetical protein LINPERPRIM_LOCUS30571 [Linum perenne]
MQEDSLSDPQCPRIQFSEEEVQSFYKPWSKELVVKILERSFFYPVLKQRLENLQARAGHIQVIDMSKAILLVCFSEADDYNRATFGGPWKLYDYYITIVRWTP